MDDVVAVLQTGGDGAWRQSNGIAQRHLRHSFAHAGVKEVLDWPGIVRVLNEEGFEGSASMVIVPKGDPEPIARKSVVYLRKVFESYS